MEKTCFYYEKDPCFTQKPPIHNSETYDGSINARGLWSYIKKANKKNDMLL